MARRWWGESRKKGSQVLWLEVAWANELVGWIRVAAGCGDG